MNDSSLLLSVGLCSPRALFVFYLLLHVCYFWNVIRCCTVYFLKPAPVITADGINSQENSNYASDHLPLLSVRKMRCLHTKYVQCVYGFCGFGWTVIDALIIIFVDVEQRNIYCEVVNILVMWFQNHTFTDRKSCLFHIKVSQMFYLLWSPRETL